MRAILLLFLVFATLLTIGFLWAEIGDLDLSKKINDEKVSNYFTALGVVGGAISLFLTYRQLKETKKDRMAATQPDLHPSFQEFQLQESPRDEIEHPGSGYILNIFNVGKDNLLATEPAFIEIENIGIGAAKDVEVVWKYKISEEMIVALENLYQYISKQEFNNVEKFSFIPAGNTVKCKVPSAFLAMFSSRLNEYSPAIRTPTFSYTDLRLFLIYWDMHHIRTVKEFFVILNVESNNRIKCSFETRTVEHSL